MHRGKEFIAIAKMILSDLRGGIPIGLEEFGDCRVLILDTFFGGGQAHGQKAGTERCLSKNESGTTGRARLLGVVVGEKCPLFGDAVDIGRASTHHPAMIGADIPDADIVRHDHDDVRFLGGRLR